MHRHALRIVAVTLAASTFAPPAVGAASTVTVAMHYTGAQQAVIEGLFDTYERANPGVDVVYQLVSYPEYLQTMLTARLGGQSPDVYHFLSSAGARFAQSGALAEPPTEVVDLVRSAYQPSVVSSVEIDGKIWGIPTEVADYLLVYNKQHLAEAGLAPPATWDELEVAAQKLTRRDADGRPVRMGFAFGDTRASVAQPWLALLYSKGVRPSTPEALRDALTSPEAVATLEDQVAVARSGASDPALDIDEIASGRVSMGILASWTRYRFVDALGPGFADTIAAAPIPAGPDWRTLSYALFFAVEKNSPNAAEAWKLLAWLNTPRAGGAGSPMSEVLVSLGGLTGSRADIAAHPQIYGDPFTQPFVAALDRAVPALSHPATNEVETALRRAIENALRGEEEPAEALENAAAEIDDVLAANE